MKVSSFLAVSHSVLSQKWIGINAYTNKTNDPYVYKNRDPRIDIVVDIGPDIYCDNLGSFTISRDNSQGRDWRRWGYRKESSHCHRREISDFAFLSSDTTGENFPR